MKQGCYELGGSDPFIVLEDSDIDLALSKGYLSRMVNNGQACINAKRFLIHDSIYDKFKSGMIERIIEAKMGNPIDPTVTLGPLAVERLADELRT
jgi:succinate-semialdehyde dehydrogenase/glutarate-semialdehyde dehydrogenase